LKNAMNLVLVVMGETENRRNTARGNLGEGGYRSAESTMGGVVSVSGGVVRCTGQNFGGQMAHEQA